MLKGITIQLLVCTQTGVDEFNAPVYSSEWVNVENVLVAPEESSDVITSTNLEGRHTRYVLGIPKGDAHVWENTHVRFLGETYRTIGIVREGIEDMIPLKWNRKISVERWNQDEEIAAEVDGYGNED